MALENRGFEAKVYIGGVAWDVKEYEVHINKSLARTDTTGLGRFQSSVVDKEVLSFSFKALSVDSTSLNPHITPQYILAAPTNPNTSVASNTDSSAIKLFPQGANVADDTKAYRATVNWEDFSHTGQAESGLQMYTAKGTSTGAFKRPGES